MIHTDGRATIAHRGSLPEEQDASLGHSIRVDAPKAPERVRESVSEMIRREQENTLNYGAWRAFANLREALEGSESITTVEDVLVVVRTLEETYEAQYRATRGQ